MAINPQEEKKEENPQKKPPLNNYTKYSSMGFQMIISIGGGVWLGTYLDEKYRPGAEFRLFTVICSLVGVFLALYLPLRELLKKP